ETSRERSRSRPCERAWRRTDESSVRSSRPDLVDGPQPDVEASSRAAKIQLPHARTLGTDELPGAIEMFVEPPSPVTERDRVVLSEALHLISGEPFSHES